MVAIPLLWISTRRGLSRLHPPTMGYLLCAAAAAAVVATLWCPRFQTTSPVPLPVRLRTVLHQASVSPSFPNTVAILQQSGARRRICGRHGLLLPLVLVATRMASKACGNCQTVTPCPTQNCIFLLRHVFLASDWVLAPDHSNGRRERCQYSFSYSGLVCEGAFYFTGFMCAGGFHWFINTFKGVVECVRDFEHLPAA